MGREKKRQKKREKEKQARGATGRRILFSTPFFLLYLPLQASDVTLEASIQNQSSSGRPQGLPARFLCNTMPDYSLLMAAQLLAGFLLSND
jgi:hypothetical protein